MFCEKLSLDIADMGNRAIPFLSFKIGDEVSWFAGLPDSFPISKLSMFKQVVQFSYSLNKQLIAKKKTDHQIVLQISIKLVEL